MSDPKPAPSSTAPAQAPPLPAKEPLTDDQVDPVPSTAASSGQAASVPDEQPPSYIDMPPAPARPAPAQHTTITQQGIVQSPNVTTPVISAPSAAAVAAASPHTQRPHAVTKAEVVATGKTPVEGVYYFDPCLRHALFSMPHVVGAAAEAALTGWRSGKHGVSEGAAAAAATTAPAATPAGTTTAGIGANPDKTATASTTATAASTTTTSTTSPTSPTTVHHSSLLHSARSYIADARFESQDGPISLSLAVIDQVSGGVMETKTDDAGTPTPVPSRLRTNTRVAVESMSGPIQVDVCDLDPNRQLDLSISTESGDVSVLLPAAYVGAIHVTAPQPPEWGRTLYPQLGRVANEYGDMYSTNLAPPTMRQATSRLGRVGGHVETSLEHTIWSKIHKHIPAHLGAQDGYVEMLVAGYAAYAYENQSNLVIKTGSGKVVVGYRRTRDEEEAHNAGVGVGAVPKQKNWWSL